ncbi:hypothetical protein Q5752_002578 [Cryptotrichosporon argae]
MRLVVAAALAAVAVRAAVTGQKLCDGFICVTGTHNSVSKTDTYTLELMDDTPLSDFGWIALGFGEGMANSPMVIAWPNSDGTFTLSQREASSEVTPKVVAKPARVATLSSNTTQTFSNTTQTTITFSLPTNTSLSTAALNATNLIYAYSSKNPKSKSTSASIVEHDSVGILQLALLANLTTSSAAVQSSSGTSGSSSKVLVAHVACGALVAFCVFPLGAVVPRFARGMTNRRWWFPMHGINQGILGLGLVIVTFGLGLTFGGSINSTHRKLGVALFVLSILQSALGVFTHYYIPDYRTTRFTMATESGRGLSNYTHMWLGTAVIILGWVTVWYGLAQEWTLRGHGQMNVGWKAGWGIAVAFWLIAYLVGLVVFLPRQLRLERTRRARTPRQRSSLALAMGPSRAHAEMATRQPPIEQPPVPRPHSDPGVWR